MSPGNDRGRPGESGLQMSIDGDTLSISRLPNFTGCPDGCSPDLTEECTTRRPLPSLDGGCCGLDAVEKVVCADRGFFCGPGRCARRQLSAWIAGVA